MVGGSDAGISAALRARELDPSVEVTVLVADSFPNFSICGLPYYLSGEVPDWRDLAHRTTAELEAAGIELLLEHEATQVDAVGHSITARSPDGGEVALGYDKLVIATGAEPVRPPIPGIENDGVFQLHTMGDSFTLNGALAGKPREAMIVGAGYIGLEMAEALRTRDVRVSVVEQLPEVLPTVDPELGALVRQGLERHQVRVLTGVGVTGITHADGRLSVRSADDEIGSADLVLVVVGVRPQTTLAVDAGVATGARGAIQVDRQMKTTVPDIYAAGDCVVTYHRLLKSDSYLPLGTTAHKQGRVAGENAVGGDRTFEGSLGTQVVKVFEHAIARTGLRDHEAESAGFETVTVESRVPDHKRYYPDTQEIVIRVTGDRDTNQLLGAQLVGPVGAEVPKRVDIFAAAIHHSMSVEAMNDLDLSYTPPFGSPWDAVQLATQTWTREHEATRATGRSR